MPVRFARKNRLRTPCDESSTRRSHRKDIFASVRRSRGDEQISFWSQIEPPSAKMKHPWHPRAKFLGASLPLRHKRAVSVQDTAEAPSSKRNRRIDSELVTNWSTQRKCPTPRPANRFAGSKPFASYDSIPKRPTADGGPGGGMSSNALPWVSRPAACPGCPTALMQLS